MAVARQIVDPPSFTPTPYGLLTTVEFPTGVNHWEGGITYQPSCSSAGVFGGSYTDCFAITGAGGAPPPPANRAGTANLSLRGATSFVIFTEFDCAPIGNAQATARAQSALARDEPWQVERAFWTGSIGGQTIVFPHLAATAVLKDPNDATITLQTAVTTVSGIAGDLLNPAMALGLLEGALADCYKGVGVIHIPELALPTFDAWGLVRKQGPLLYTANGNKVAVGAGYPGSGADGSARTSNSATIFATGNVFGFRSDVRIRAPQGAAAMDRSTNTMKMIAERTYVLAWDCCHLAANVVLGVPKGT